MDRAEYKERIARIDGLIKEGNKDEALDLLDSINWKKVLNVNYLVEGAERYEIIGKLEDSKELLETAHDRSPMGRMIIYHLAICCAKLGEIETARGYYQKFIELAPNDNIRFIIKYQISLAQGADDSTLISILEELRANELLEDWAYELACLYRKNGQIDKCIAVLDDIILWFGEGPYVEKALETKLLYRPLSKDQEIRYQRMTTEGETVLEIHPEEVSNNEFLGRTIRIPKIEESTDRFNTQNLQAEIRKNIDEIMRASEVGEVTDNIDAIKGLIEEIPHLQMEEAIPESIEEKKFNTKKMDEKLKSKFKEYLSEEFDGQLSLSETGKEKKDEQIDGQLTIEDVVERWEKTKRAAEQALFEAKQQELMKYKEEALARASDVLDKLIESEGGSVETISKPSADSQKTFKIPKIDAEGTVEEDFEIPVISIDDVMDEDSPEERATDQEVKEWNPPNISAEETLKGINEMLQGEIDKLSEDDSVDEPEEDSDNQVDEAVEEIEDTNDEVDENISVKIKNETTDIPLIDVSEIKEETKKELSDQEKHMLSYFASIPGMEEQLYNVLKGIKTALSANGPLLSGHVIIQGREGSGKTRLAQNIIRIIQAETGKPTGNIGRIDGEKLNEKDIRILFDKIRGGVLIIENVGKLNKDTIVSLTLNIEGDISGTLVIVEDKRENIENIMNSDLRFAKKFTEKISVPVMTIDELVNFGKIYAAENGYTIDEMGVLALYDRVNVLEKPQQPASIKDVKSVMDEAISSAHNTKFKGLFGLFGNKGSDDSGALVLQERDFRQD